MKSKLTCLNRYRELKTELENTNYLFRPDIKVRELQYLSKILSGRQLEIEMKKTIKPTIPRI